MNDNLGDSPRLAATFAELREAVDLHVRGLGMDHDAEADVVAFRDGVVPRVVSALTVGRTEQARTCQERINAASKGHRPRTFAVSTVPGDGLTHFLHLVAELAGARGMATAWLVDRESVRSPLAVQTSVLSSAMLGSRSLFDCVEPQPPHDPGIQRAAERLSERLTPGAVRGLTIIFESLRSGHPEAALPVYRWLCGQDPGANWRVAQRLPAKPALTLTWSSLLEACCLLTQIAGSRGLVLLVDLQGLAAAPQWLDSPASHCFVISGLASPDDVDSLTLPSLTRDQGMQLAAIIRDRHIAAYAWPSAEAVADSELQTLVAPLSWRTTRECVRSIVANLDQTLARQSC